MGYDDFGDREATRENIKNATVVGFNPEMRVHRNTQEAAMDAAYVRAVEFGERYWVVPDGEGGWYACPASDKREREDGL